MHIGKENQESWDFEAKSITENYLKAILKNTAV